MTGDSRIFISYSRQDGADAAAEIREGLAAEGLSLWQDLVAMEGGRDWWRQIEEAIGKAEYLVLLLTPKALESEVCAKEWRYARQQGTYVVPVSDGPPGRLELDRLAGWMRRADIVDFRVPERWTWLVGRLKQPPQVRRVPMMAEAPPSDFVPRPAEFAKLKAALLDPATKDAVGITAALKGAGGYGKTTLARALCADEEIQDAYHDGVLWVTLGESPGDPLGRVADLIEIVAGGRPGFANVEAACVRLEELLADRRMLVVIDDAWSAADTRPFLRGGPHCARLITTRDNATLPRGAAEQSVDEMRGAEAVALLCADLPPGEDEALRRLAARLGEWPLLLRLANGALVDRVTRSRASLPDALAHVGRLLDKRGLTAFDAKDARERHEAVGKTLALSLDRLDPNEQARLGELAVFPEDVQVPLGTVGLFWRETANLDDIDTDDLLQRLFRLSLLLQLDLDRRFLQLHDVIRTWLRERLGGHLGEVDEALVAAFRSRCGGEWHQLDDPYALAHLPMHLWSTDEAAWHRLLLDPRWMARRLAADGPGVAALLDDYRDTDADLRLVGDALRLSAHVIGGDPMQLPAQLCGRLGNSPAASHVELVAATRAAASRGMLLPRHPTLIAPGGPLIRTLDAHTDAVNAVALLPDGSRALSGSGDRTLKLWDLESGAVLRTFVGHTNSVTAVALLRDGRRALSASWDNTLKLWDLESGAVLCTLEGHANSVTALTILPGDRRALLGSYDGTIKLWDLENGVVLRTLAAHRKTVTAVILELNGRRALSSSDDGTLKVWDLERFTVVRTLKAHRYNVKAMAILPDGHRALSGSDDMTLKLWDLDSGVLLRTYEDHRRWRTGPVAAVALLPDGRRALSCLGDATLKMWDLEGGAVVRTFEGHGSLVSALAILPDGRRALSSSWDRTVKLWELESGDLLQRAGGHGGPVATVALTPDGRCALSGSLDGTIKLWDLESGGSLRTFEVGMAVAAATFLPDGRRALCNSGRGRFALCDLESGAVLRIFEQYSTAVSALILLPDGRRALSGSDDGSLTLWDLDSGDMLRGFYPHGARVTALALLPGGHYALSGSWDHTLKLWELESGALRCTLKGGGRRITTVTSLPDGRRALSGFSNGILELWDLETRTVLRTFEAGGEVVALTILPDGHRALSVSKLRRTLWDLESGNVLRSYEGSGVWNAVTLLSDSRCAIFLEGNRLVLRDLERGDGVVTWTADRPICCAVAVSDRFFIAGDEGGSVHFLDLV